MKAIAALQDKKELSALVAKLQNDYALGVFYTIDVQQDQKDSTQTDRECWGRAGSRFRTARTTI